MKRLIVHVGLPKTATTTLQHHIFQDLHEQGQLNFLGKAVDLEDSRRLSNYRGIDIRRACQETIHRDISSRIDQMLVDDRLNVFSDEGILAYYPGQENVPLERRIENLKTLLSPFNVKVLLTLRNPLIVFFSLYVELYPQIYRRLASLDSFEKCADDLLSRGLNNIRYEFFDLERVVSVITSRFDTSILLYEDIAQDPARFAQALGELLAVEPDYLVKQLSSQRANYNLGTTRGAYSKEVTRLKTKLRRLDKHIASLGSLHRFLRQAYSKDMLGIRRILNKPRQKAMKDKEHLKPDGELKYRLQEVLGVKDLRLFEAHGLDHRRLEAYGYLSSQRSSVTDQPLSISL